MKCPRDGAQLQKVHVGALGLDLDKCHKCDGVWCDHGEMERLRDSHFSGVEDFVEQMYGNPEYVECDVDGYMRCPICSDGRLQEFTYTYSTKVSIDRCDKCMGVWLDAGELNSIVTEKAALEVAAGRGKLRAFIKAMDKLMGR